MNVPTPTIDIATAPGVYLLVDEPAPEALARIARKHGFAFFHLSGTSSPDEDSFLKNIASAMHFPDYYGQNWNALDECIRDLSWVPAAGYILLYDNFERFARDDHAAWEIALDVFAWAVEGWQERKTPMYVLLRGDGTAAPGLPTLRLPAALAGPDASPSSALPDAR